MISIEIVSLLLVTIINALIVWVLATEGWKTVMNRFFILAVFFTIFWAFGTLLFYIGTTPAIAHFGILLFYVAPMFTIAFLALFAMLFPQPSGRNFVLANMMLCIITVFFAGAIILNPSILTREISIHTGVDGLNSLVVNPVWYSVYAGYFDLAFIIAFAGFGYQIWHQRGKVRKQLIAIFVGTLATAVFSLVTNLGLPILGNSHFIWLGPTWTLFYIVTISISIVRHQLFDVKLAAIRTIAYGCVLVTLSAIYYLLAYLLSVLVIGTQTTNEVSVSPINIVLALLLAFLFQPLKHFFDKVTNKIFFRNTYNSEEFFAALSELLASTTDLRGLLERASQEIATTLKAEQAFFFLYYSNAINHHLSSGTRGHARLPAYDAETLDKYVLNHKEEIIMTDLLPDKDEAIRRLLVSHRVTILMPLRHRDHLIGYLCLGDRLTSNYTKRDLKVLKTIADELVIAIQNALSVHEVREINATLQQRIHVATAELRETNSQLHRLDAAKDEFVSMASHQLRTPLTSVKGYISMMLDGDVGKITEIQRNVLEEAFNSSERMVRLIGDFLSVSRLQTGKFVVEKKAVDLMRVVEQEIDGLRIIASTHGQKLAFVHPKRLPLISIDEAKIRQVMMNFIDNAIYYSRPDMTIHIVLSKLDNEVIFTVEDSGIGVPASEQAHLFNKFYRASNARKQRPDGTGVGLYLAKKIITEHHGKVIFSSIENQGSVFGFRIPLTDESSETTDKANDAEDHHDHRK